MQSHHNGKHIPSSLSSHHMIALKQKKGKERKETFLLS